MAPGLARESPTSIAPIQSLPDRSEKNGLIEDTTDIVDIATDGDLVLNVRHLQQSQKFRVRVKSLRSKSKYFARLLEPGRFGEGSQVDSKLQTIHHQYSRLADVPAIELPLVSVEDLGRISSVKSIAALCADFFQILHDHDLATAPPIINLANLAIVADRFDALDSVSLYIQRKKFIPVWETRTTPKLETSLTEDKIRQRLLVAIFYHHLPWIEKYSARLIARGWVGATADLTTPLWHDLPFRLEDELVHRRDSILETIDSIQTHFLTLYTSRDRQCKLGYDSSAQCDSFQLGEMIKFFRRNDTLRLHGTIAGAGADASASASPDAFDGDVYGLLETLRQVPEYQIDRNHHHCGLRTRLVPLLDLVLDGLRDARICGRCWTEARTEYAWTEAKRPVSWRRQDDRSTDGHGARHDWVRDMFTATSRDWS